MKFVLVVVAAVLACSCRKQAPPNNEFEAFERKYVAETEQIAARLRAEGRKIADKEIPKTYPAVFIGPSGIFVNRKVVATLAELDSKREQIITAIDYNATLLPSLGFSPVVTYDLDAEPAAVAIASLRLFAGRATTFSIVRRNDPECPHCASEVLCSTITLRDQPRVLDLPQLTILLDADRIWVGLSKIREFQDIADREQERDFEKLSTTLREHKMSELFDERIDIELGAGGGTAGDVIHALRIACDAGFPDIAVLPRDQLTAVPQL